MRNRNLEQLFATYYDSESDDDLDACVRELHNLIQTQHCRTAQRKAFIRQIQKELTEREETLL